MYFHFQIFRIRHSDGFNCLTVTERICFNGASIDIAPELFPNSVAIAALKLLELKAEENKCLTQIHRAPLNFSPVIQLC